MRWNGVKCCSQDFTSSSVAEMGGGTSGDSPCVMSSGAGMAVPKLPIPYPLCPPLVKGSAGALDTSCLHCLGTGGGALETGMSEAEPEAEADESEGGYGGGEGTSCSLFSGKDADGGRGTRGAIVGSWASPHTSYQPSSKVTSLLQSKNRGLLSHTLSTCGPRMDSARGCSHSQ